MTARPDDRAAELGGTSLTVVKVVAGESSDIVVTFSAPRADYEARLSRPNHVCGQVLHLRARDVVTIERVRGELCVKPPCGCLYAVHVMLQLPDKGRPIAGSGRDGAPRD